MLAPVWIIMEIISLGTAEAIEFIRLVNLDLLFFVGSFMYSVLMAVLSQKASSSKIALNAEAFVSEVVYFEVLRPRFCIFLQMLYCADHPYDAEGDFEISLLKSDLVKVLQQRDISGNGDWWLVEREDGRQGYVPAAFLSKAILPPL